MFNRNRLACSFCGKTAAEVSKLVAGPKVYICDACVAAAARIMSEPEHPHQQEFEQVPSIWSRAGRWFHCFGPKVRVSLSKAIGKRARKAHAV